MVVETSRGPGRPRLPSDAIVTAAMELIDSRGGGELSMRSLAAEMGSSTSTLYRHFPSRAVLVGAVIDRMLGEVSVDPATYRSLPWREASRRLIKNLFEAMARHPNVSSLMANHTPVGTNSAGIRERWLALMLDDGFPVEVAARSGAMIAHFALGFAIQLGGERSMGGRDRQALRESVHKLDLSEYPATAAVAHARWKPTSIEEEFAFGLEMVLDGIGLLRGD